MKVYIGPYIHLFTCDIYRNYMNKKYGFDNWPKEKSKFEIALKHSETILQNVLNATLNKIQRERKRNIKVKIDNTDIWSFDETLAHIIIPGLKKLRDEQKGAPFVDNSDVPKRLRMSIEDRKQFNINGTTDDMFFERWFWVINEMIFAFESKIFDWEQQFHINTFDKEGYMKYQKRISNGFRLFGKYYEGLWL